MALRAELEREKKDKDALWAELTTTQKKLTATEAMMNAELSKLAQAAERKDKASLKAELATVQKNLTVVMKAEVTKQVEAQCILARRNLQSQGPVSQGEFVRIYKYSLHDGHAIATTKSGVGEGDEDGHRRSLQDQLGCDLAVRSPTINTECCATADCSGGILHECDKRCAAVLMPFWAECGDQLPQAVIDSFKEAVSLCPALSPSAGSAGGAHAVREFKVVCPAGVVAAGAKLTLRGGVKGGDRPPWPGSHRIFRPFSLYLHAILPNTSPVLNTRYHPRWRTTAYRSVTLTFKAIFCF
jgi:hypothetical protein